MEKREFKDKVFTELARVTGALGNPRRLEIIDLLANGEKTVEKIANATGISIANASQHLQVLKTGNLVEVKRQANYIYYRLASVEVLQIWTLLRDFGTSRIAEIERVVREFRTEKNSLQSVTASELLSKIQIENVILLDVRPQEEYEAGHIDGAVCIPIEQLTERLSELPLNMEVIAYCRGPFCVFADEAIQILRNGNYSASRLEEGFADWKLMGLPVNA
ncbi:MAG: metalloregulator ArsR/SmtB family transcription factor [Phormidesmis sp. FL-bin-119]|nr:metalloregulator ArsR/SmtB family transcription factor [Pedobacter sp.]